MNDRAGKKSKLSTAETPRETRARASDDATSALPSCANARYPCRTIECALTCGPAHVQCAERVRREGEEKAKASGGGAWYGASSTNAWSIVAARSPSTEALAWLDGHGMLSDDVAFAEAVKTGKVEAMKWLCERRGAEYWRNHPTTSLNSLLRTTCARMATDSELKVVRFLRDQGAVPDRPMLDVALGNFSLYALKFCFECGLTASIEQHQLLEVARSASVEFVKYVREICGAEFNQAHLESAVSGLKYETVQYLIDAGVSHNVDALIDELSDTMNQDDTLEWQDEDPFRVRTLHDQLRKYLRQLKGITPEKDRSRLRTILRLVDDGKDSIQTAEYLDICEYLKRLHKEAAD